MKLKHFVITAALTTSIEASLASAADFDYSNNRAYLRKYPDLACVDTGPLSTAEANALTGAKLQELGRTAEISVTRPGCHGDGNGAPAQLTEKVSGSEYLDRLYARLGSGPVPDGMYAGLIILSRDRGLANISEVGFLVPGESQIEKLGQQLWSGKFFDRDRMFLKNKINLTGITWDSSPTSLADSRLKFPAKLYCGQSLFDGRRESIIIDYKYGVEDRPEGISTDDNLDWLAGTKGLLIRDEIRMVKPGLYLGRAYLQGAFGLYFVLSHVPGTGVHQPQDSEKDACWIGHQRQKQLGMKQSDFVNHFAN